MNSNNPSDYSQNTDTVGAGHSSTTGVSRNVQGISSSTNQTEQQSTSSMNFQGQGTTTKNSSPKGTGAQMRKSDLLQQNTKDNIMKIGGQKQQHTDSSTAKQTSKETTGKKKKNAANKNNQGGNNTSNSNADQERPPVPTKQHMMKQQGNAGHQNTIEHRLDYCCETQGINRQQVQNVTEIDFSLDDCVRMDFLAHFTNLRVLTMCNQGLGDIEGIDKLRNLEKVWLVCNQFESIRGFDRLTYLRELYLGNNRIKRIRNLDKCINLEKLWIDDNKIDNIDGLNNLHKLEQLNLAGNKLESIGMGLDGLVSLSDLNLSANKIGNFKEVLNLNRLPCLQVCTFSDPHYGDNPICNLCNYQTYVLYHLPRLHKLDTMYISEDAKNFAEATFMKKRMYYNMRIKTIQRNSSNIMKLLKVCRKVRNFKIDIQVSKLMKKLTEIQRELEERQYITQSNIDQFEPVFSYGPENLTRNPLDSIDNEKLVSDIENKKALITGRMHDRNEDLKDLETIYESLTKKVYEMSDQNIHRLMTELETGGNIRFEEGKPTDKWFSSCVDLVRSRFNAEQMKFFGIIGINVTRVTRIHNRFLRNRFEEKLEQLVDLSDNTYKRSLEYLFYGVDPISPQEIHRAMEEGFRSQQENQDVGLPNCIALVNSVASAEIARINSFFQAEDGFAHIRTAAKAQKQTDYRMSSELTLSKGLVQIPSGQLLVCKVFLSKCLADQNYSHFNPSHAPSEIWRYAPVDVKHYQNVQSVYRTKENDPKQRMWFVLDNALVLPEYLVEFEYVINQKAAMESKRLSDQSVINSECNQLFKGITQTQKILENTYIRYTQRDNPRLQNLHLSAVDLDRSDMGCLKKVLHNFMTQCHIKELMENGFEFIDDDAQNSAQAAIENSMPPDIPMRSQVDKITDHLIRNMCRENDFKQIIYLNLFNNKIKKINALEQMVNLQILILSFNEIEEIDGLQNCFSLKKLDLNHNFIRMIQNLEDKQSLTFLDLTHNWVSDISQIEHLTIHCPSLKELGLKCNPIATKKQYRPTIFQRIPKLVKLDSQAMTEKDKERVKNDQSVLTQETIFESLKNNKKNYTEQFKNTDIVKDSNQRDWDKKIEALQLSHLNISVVTGLESYVNLRKLQLIDNNISRVQGLENCKLLEELSLEKNKIETIENIGHLRYLKKLDLGQNRIKRITNLNNLEQLTQLSLEDNEIHQLNGLEELQTLMELYLGNNLIGDVKEIIKLKELQRLIILDISGNNLNNDQGYRIYCIFHLKKLRVLDGMSIEQTEHLEAKDTFAGRLTDEILDSKLNGRNTHELRELDLQHCKLRDFENMFDQQNFPVLKELNLSHNMLQSMRGFGYLPNLRILKIKQNRLEKLLCQPKDDGYPIGLFGLHGLELLDVSYNNLQDLMGLQYSPLKDLKIFNASNNEIVKVEHLEKLKQLRELDLSKNRIRSIDATSFQIQHMITILHLEDNGLRNLVNIEKLDRLQSLFVSGNRLVEFWEVDRLAEIPHLMEISLNNNPMSRKPNYRMSIIKRLPNLFVLDAKEITMEERNRVDHNGMPDGKVPPMVHFQQYPTVKVPVKLNPVNFDGVFNNLKFSLEQQSPNTNQSKGGPLSGVVGNSIVNQHQQPQDMHNLIQVQSIQMGGYTPSHENSQQNPNNNFLKLPNQQDNNLDPQTHNTISTSQTQQYRNDRMPVSKRPSTKTNMAAAVNSNNQFQNSSQGQQMQQQNQQPYQGSNLISQSQHQLMSGNAQHRQQSMQQNPSQLNQNNNAHMRGSSQRTNYGQIQSQNQAQNKSNLLLGHAAQNNQYMRRKN